MDRIFSALDRAMSFLTTPAVNWPVVPRRIYALTLPVAYVLRVVAFAAFFIPAAFLQALMAIRDRFKQLWKGS